MRHSNPQWATVASFAFSSFLAAAAMLPAQAQDVAKKAAVSNEKERVLRGLICDRDGNPLPGATVFRGSYYGEKCKTDDDGQFAIPAYRGSTTVPLLAQAEKDGKQLRCLRFVDYVTGEENVTLRLSQAVAIRGRVTSGGKPLAGAVVVAYLENRYFNTRGISYTGGKVTTDDNGDFALSGLYPYARYKLHVIANGFAAQWSDWISVDLRKQQGPQPEFRLREAPGSVAGRVVDAEGNALAGILLRLGHPDTPDANAITDKDGNFTFADLAPGQTVLIWYPGMGPGDPLKVSVGTKDLVIKIEKKSSQLPGRRTTNDR